MPKPVYTVQPIKRGSLDQQQQIEWITKFGHLFEAYSTMDVMGINLANSNEKTNRHLITSFTDLANDYYFYTQGQNKLFDGLPENVISAMDKFVAYQNSEISFDEYMATIMDLYKTYMPVLESKLPEIPEEREIFDPGTGLDDEHLAEKLGISEMDYALYIGLRAFEKMPIYEDLLPEDWKVFDPAKENEIHSKRFTMNVLPENTGYDSPSVAPLAKQYLENFRSSLATIISNRFMISTNGQRLCACITMNTAVIYRPCSTLLSRLPEPAVLSRMTMIRYFPTYCPQELLSV